MTVPLNQRIISSLMLPHQRIRKGYSPSNRRLHDGSATCTSEFIVRRFQASTTRTFVIQLGTKVNTAAKQLAAYQRTRMQPAFILFDRRELPLLSLGFCFVSQRTANPAALVPTTTSQCVTDPLAQNKLAGSFHLLLFPTLHCYFAFSASTNSSNADFTWRTGAFMTLASARVLTARLRLRTGFTASRNWIGALLSRFCGEVD